VTLVLASSRSAEATPITPRTLPMIKFSRELMVAGIAPRPTRSLPPVNQNRSRQGDRPGTASQPGSERAKDGDIITFNPPPQLVFGGACRRFLINESPLYRPEFVDRTKPNRTDILHQQSDLYGCFVIIPRRPKPLSSISGRRLFATIINSHGTFITPGIDPLPTRSLTIMDPIQSRFGDRNRPGTIS
jgi:hypothetical protein